MKYIIIGLGNYGGVLAEELTALGHEVVGVDSKVFPAEHLKDKLATTYIIDATDESALSVLPLDKVDIVIVAIGENFGASVRVVSLLKKRKVAHIYARAVDDVHKSVLEAFSVDRILTPEMDAAKILVHLMELDSRVEMFDIDGRSYIFKFQIPNKLVGYKMSELNLESEFNINIISLVKGKRASNALGITHIERMSEYGYPDDHILSTDDALVCYGKYSDLISFWRSVK